VLDRKYPDADCALNWRNPYELISATILSHNARRARENGEPALFARYPTAADLAKARPGMSRHHKVHRLLPGEDEEKKSHRLRAGTHGRHGGEVPRRMEDLVKLPGTGARPPASCSATRSASPKGSPSILTSYGSRNRLGLVDSGVQARSERQLMALVPQDRWIKTTDLLIAHGRQTCGALRPQCGECPVFALCRWEHRQAYAMGEPPSGRVQRRHGRGGRP